MYPRWCSKGLTKSQKRRVQRLRHRELEEECTQGKRQVRSQVWRVKQKADETAPSASANIVFILPMELKAPSDDEETKEQAMAQLTLDASPKTVATACCGSWKPRPAPPGVSPSPSPWGDLPAPSGGSLQGP
jgi:hypothetical protein